MAIMTDKGKRLLKAEEIECKLGNWNDKNKKERYTVLLYKTARTDMDVLDEVFGKDNWQVEYSMVGTMLFCTLSVWSEARQCWIRKQSNGVESDYEAEKGKASDAFKRAGFMFGIGRELYSAPMFWLDASISPYTLKVDEIGYDENDKISTLVISSKGKVVYEMRNNEVGKNAEQKKPVPKQTDKPSPDHDTLERIRDIVEKLEFEGKNTDEILAFYHAKTIGEIPLEKWEKMLAKVRSAT